jgi:hypothetical protein
VDGTALVGDRRRQPSLSELNGLLGGVVTDEQQLELYLQRVVDALQARLPRCDAAGVTVIVAGRARTAAYTDESTLLVDQVQYELGDGPCLDAYRRQAVNNVDVAEVRSRWPEFAARAAHVGLRSVLAVPLAGSSGPQGALNLYSRELDAFSDLAEDLVGFVGQRLGDVLDAALRLLGAERLVAQLEEAMASRATIEQAKGVLMALHRLDPETAFALLREQSQRRNVKLRDVAREIVSSVVPEAGGASA